MFKVVKDLFCLSVPSVVKTFLCENLAMRMVSLLVLLATATAQSPPQLQLSHTTESLRGVSAVSRQIAWASGTHGTYLRTIDAGRTWTPAQVPDATTLDFRAVVAFSANEAFLMSSGSGDQSRIYHTTDAGQHWQLQFTNTNPKGFFDSMQFWDPKHGIVLGDPIPDETGKLHFELLQTEDGQTWHRMAPQQLPEALEGEGAFAASNTCIAILHSPSVILSGAMTSEAQSPRSRRIPISFQQPSAQQTFATSQSLAIDQNLEINKSPVIPSKARNLLSAGATNAAAASTPQPAQPWQSGASAPRQPAANEGASVPVSPDPIIWFATGGKTARVFHSPDAGKTWEVSDTPILHGQDSTGIFSIAFRDPLHGVIAGGDYKRPRDDGPNLAFTEDGGKTWTLSQIKPQAYFSAVAYDVRVNQEAKQQEAAETTAEKSGKKIRVKPTQPERLFVVGHDFVFDFRPPNNPRRLSGNKKHPLAFNAVTPFPEGGALIVGPKGSIVLLP